MTTTVNGVLFGSRARAERRLAAVLATSAVVGTALGSDAVSPTAAARSLAGLLDMPVGNLLLDTWTTNRLVAGARTRTLADPEREESVCLLQAAVTRVEHPEIALDLGASTITLVRLTLELEMALESVVIHVKAGEVHAIGPAHGWVDARLKTDAHTLAEHRSRLTFDRVARRLRGPGGTDAAPAA